MRIFSCYFSVFRCSTRMPRFLLQNLWTEVGNSQKAKAGYPKNANFNCPSGSRGILQPNFVRGKSCLACQQTLSSSSQEPACMKLQKKSSVKGGGSSPLSDYPRASSLPTSTQQQGLSKEEVSLLCQGWPGFTVNPVLGGNTAGRIIKQQAADENSLLISTNSSLIDHRKISLGSKEQTHHLRRLKLYERRIPQRTADLGWIRWPDRSFPRFNLFNSLSFPQ